MWRPEDWRRYIAAGLWILALGCAIGGSQVSCPPGSVVSSGVVVPVDEPVLSVGSRATWCETVDGTRSGPYVARYRWRARAAAGVLSQSKPDGLWQTWYANGIVKQVARFQLGEPVGTWLAFSESGELISETPFDDGQIDGVVITYHENGIVSQAIGYAAGVADGRWEYFGVDGSLVARGEHRKGLVEGQETWFFPSGSVQKLINYEDGKESGDFFVYYPNGALRVRGTYDRGVKSGKWNRFNERGELEDTVDYPPVVRE